VGLGMHTGLFLEPNHFYYHTGSVYRIIGKAKQMGPQDSLLIDLPSIM